jgi:hypothetical protein
VIGWFAGAALLAGAARAEEAELEAGARAETPLLAQRALRLSLGTGLTVGLSDVETQRSDVVEYSSSAYLWNVHAAASYRLGSAWALGGHGSWSSDAGARTIGSSDGGSVELSRELWQIAAEARFQPRGWLGPYAALSAGAAASVDRAGNESATQWAPLLGASAGYAFEIADPLSIDLGLTGGLAFFDADGAGAGSDLSPHFTYGTSAWLGASVLAAVPF